PARQRKQVREPVGAVTFDRDRRRAAGVQIFRRAFSVGRSREHRSAIAMKAGEVKRSAKAVVLLFRLRWTTHAALELIFWNFCLCISRCKRCLSDSPPLKLSPQPGSAQVLVITRSA